MRRFCSGLIKNHYIFKNFIAKGTHYTMGHEGVADMVEMVGGLFGNVGHNGVLFACMCNTHCVL